MKKAAWFSLVAGLGVVASSWAQDPIYGTAEIKRRPRTVRQEVPSYYDTTSVQSQSQDPSEVDYYDPALGTTYINNINVYGRRYNPFFRPSFSLGYYTPFAGGFGGPFNNWGFGLSFGYGAFGPGFGYWNDPWFDPWYSRWNSPFWYDPWFGYNPYWGYGGFGNYFAFNDNRNYVVQGRARSGYENGLSSRRGSFTRPSRSGITANPGVVNPSRDGYPGSGNVRPRRDGGINPKYRPSTDYNPGRERNYRQPTPRPSERPSYEPRNRDFDGPSRPSARPSERPSAPSAPSYRGGSPGGGGAIRGGGGGGFARPR
ncbi:MAG TPA: hypothetical protein VFV37_08945 [Luteibaculaceae bacterium]|nr:hypothetical protein [Luteibaculaceae bacterium]